MQFNRNKAFRCKTWAQIWDKSQIYKRDRFGDVPKMSIQLHPSALSVVELAYFFTLRLGLNICLPRREDLMPAAVTRWHSMFRDWGQRRETGGSAGWGAQYGIGRNYSWGPS